MERISRMEKAFYPRNDTVNAVVSNLLPRDPGQDIILKDQHDEPVYLQRSSILDGTSVRGFGYVNSKPYKWNLEIETAVKSVAVVPDRFFSIYGKSYPIKRQQTVGINQPSELFKYEIIYLRGYDMYEESKPEAKIIYHAQAEGKPKTDVQCAGDAEALSMLDDFNDYPYLKIRVCWDGSIRAYLGTTAVDWDLERQVEDKHADPDVSWVEMPQINTDQFRHIDMWVRFDSINALSYYIITKYENNIFNIAPKTIKGGIENVRDTMNKKVFTVSADVSSSKDVKDSLPSIAENRWFTKSAFENYLSDQAVQGLSIITDETYFGMKITTEQYEEVKYLVDGEANLKIQYTLPDGVTLNLGNVAEVVGLDYELSDPEWTKDTSGCTPCCKKDNLSRSIWAYVNPKTMTPYDDDYWFHQGEPYYKKSLTLSTKENPLKAQKILVEQGVFPGMYKIVAETLIRERETGEDQRIQITLPLCKIKSDHTLTLQADGDPTTFNLDVEVATPQNGIPMEITFYEVEEEMKTGCSGTQVPKDGSTKISAK